MTARIDPGFNLVKPNLLNQSYNIANHIAHQHGSKQRYDVCRLYRDDANWIVVYNAWCSSVHSAATTFALLCIANKMCFAFYWLISRAANKLYNGSVKWSENICRLSLVARQWTFLNLFHSTTWDHHLGANEQRNQHDCFSFKNTRPYSFISLVSQEVDDSGADIFTVLFPSGTPLPARRQHTLQGPGSLASVCLELYQAQKPLAQVSDTSTVLFPFTQT